VLDGNVGILKHGFWWEFFARAPCPETSPFARCPDAPRENPGETVVYRPTKVPGIAWNTFRLAKLSREFEKFLVILEVLPRNNSASRPATANSHSYLMDAFSTPLIPR